MKQSLSVFAPPLALLVIGTAAYIVVVQMTTPEPIVVSGNAQVEQSSEEPTPSPTVVTGSALGVTDSIDDWQQAVNSGQELWRTDPLSAAQHLGESYGFVSTDAYSLTSSGTGQATVTVTHAQQTYVMTMYQPEQKGQGGVWAVQSISRD